MRRALCFLLLACSRAAPPPDLFDAGAGLQIRSCGTVLRFAPARPVIQVYAAGEWNQFSTTADKLDRKADGSYALTLALPAGEYGYKLVIDGAYALDPANPWTRYVGGVENSALRVPDCQAPLVEVAAWTVAAGALDATLRITDGAGRHGIDASGFTATLDGAPLPPSAFLPDGTVRLHKDALAAGKHVVQVAFSDRAGAPARALFLPLWIEAQPFQWRDATLYFALVDRFANGDPSNDRPVPGVEAAANFQGGDFKGLTARIESGWFDQLGVRAIWISNPQQQPQGAWPGADGHLYTGYHGYWPASATQVDARFGTEAELRALVDAAHRRGIRVLLDFVANHVHTEHPWWAQHPPPDAFFNPLHLADGRTCLCSTAPGYCSYDAPEGLQCWFAPYLPDINSTDPDAVLAVEQLAVDWMQRTGADGLRVDAVKQFPHIVGRRLRARLHEELEASGVPVYLVGETFTGSWGSGGQELVKQFVSPTELHGQFDFPLYWELRAALAENSGAGFVPLEAALSGEQGYYGADALMSPFLGNHDLPRFLSVAAGQQIADPWNNLPSDPPGIAPYAQAQVAFTLLLTLPGVPLIYQGDEVATPGAGDPDNRRRMRFDGLSANAQGVLDRVRALGTLRQREAALRRGAYRTLLVDADVLVYARQLGGAPTRIVALNRSAAAQQRTVQLAPDLGIAAGVRPDALSGPDATVADGKLQLSLPARTGAVY